MAASRDACDRCHVMKTRCERLPTARMCQRCDRLGVSCNYSPPGRTGRPQGARRAKNKSNNSAKSTEQRPTPPPTDMTMMDESYGFTAPKSHPGGNPEGNDWADDIHQHALWLQELNNLFPQGNMSTGDMSQSSGTPQWQPNSPPLDISDFSGGMPIFPIPQLPAEHLQMEGILGTPFKPRSVTPLDEDMQMHQLLELQGKLGLLAKSFRNCRDRKSQLSTPPSHSPISQAFSTGSGLSDDVEEIYRATETFVEILTAMWQLEETDWHNTDINMGTSSPFESSTDRRYEQQSFVSQPNGSTVLLLLSCYSSLIQVFELLITIIRERLQDHSQQQQAMHFRSDSSQSSSSSSPSARDVPGISIGRFQLAMPQKVVLQVHLHLIVQIMQRLKGMMKLSASRMRRRKGAEDLGGNDTGKEKADFMDMGEVILMELGMQEENMLANLQQTNLIAEDRS